MTAEKQYVDDFESAYQGKAWTKGKMLGIMLVVGIAMAIRDIGMVFVYGSIYDKIALEGVDVGVGFMSYVFMILLYLLPLILPMVLRFTNGAYDNEVETSLVPSFNKKYATIIMYVVVAIVSIAPIVLFMVGVFTSAYMFVAVNLALLLFSTVTVFYYFGTYMLQRARKSLAQKYVMSTVMMVLTSLLAVVISAGVVAALYFAGVNVSVITYLTGFLEKWDMVEFIIKAVGMFAVVGLACVVSGLLYNLTQNIIYSATPTFIFTYANIVLLQRIREASTYLTSAESSLADYKNKLAAANDAKSIENYTSKIEELEANIPGEQAGVIAGYVFIGIMVAVLIALGVYAIIGLKRNLKDAK
ncbi:MAG: hypothetical protein IJ011_01265 [Clostridia bacterium]|nr:hypothetical protein [Clostridia bacterium]